MILIRPGAEFEYDGKKYVIGEYVVGTEASEYDGLIGTITEIRDGEDKETENETPDIYCSFEPPVNPYDIQRLEQLFSDIYQQTKTMEDIILDEVIMAPEMIESLRTLREGTGKLPLYVVKEEWVLDAESGYSATPHMDYRSARLQFSEDLEEDQKNGCGCAWAGRDTLVIESGQDLYECYLDGEYCMNHYKISIQKYEIAMSDAVLGTMGRTYIDQCRMEDFASHVAEWDELVRLPKAQYLQFVADPGIPERIHKKLEKNDPYWESYWDSISAVAHELLDEYLKKDTHPTSE